MIIAITPTLHTNRKLGISMVVGTTSTTSLTVQVAISKLSTMFAPTNVLSAKIGKSFMNKLTQEVRDDVARLLAMVCNDNTDSESYEFVLNKLTRMAILGTAPPASRSSSAPTWSYEPTPKVLVVDSGENFSEDKTNWIEGRR